MQEQRRSVLAILAFIAIGGAAGMAILFAAFRSVYVYRFHPQPCASPATPAITAPAGMPAGERELTVLSYNIEGHAALLDEAHLAGIGRVVTDEQADVVGLQEVHRYTWQSRFNDQASELARRTGMQVFFGPSLEALGGEFGNAVLTRGRILEGQVIPLPSVGEPRSLLRVRVDLDGFPLTVFVTHLSAWGSLARGMRQRQAECLASHLRAEGEPFVLCGDLNAAPGAPDLIALLQGDAARLCGLATEPTYALLGRRLDYIFSDPGWQVLAAGVPQKGPSDHWPVSARLRWMRKG